MAMKRRLSLPPIIETVALEDASHTNGSNISPKSEAPYAQPNKASNLSPAYADNTTSISEEALNDTKGALPHSWPWHTFSLLVSFLWLAPTTTLLILNFKSHVIGASVWCPFGRCASDALNSDAIATAVRLNHRDHDVLPGLQYVAQAFEIWFLFISTALLYDVGMLFTRSKGGLPMGFLMTHVEFSDVKSLTKPYLWTSAFSNRGASIEERRRRRTTKLFLFALLAVFLTILTNLMGAATAVLLLPTLSWVETEKVPQRMFDGIGTSQPPHGDDIFIGGCNNAQLQTGNYSCTSDFYGPSLDEWAAKARSSIRQFEQPNGIAILGTSQESASQFALNASDDLELIWIANRQVLRDVSSDYLKATGQCHDCLRAGRTNNDTAPDPTFNKSLQTFLQRTGPSLGVRANCFAGKETVVKVGTEKDIHCFDAWSLDGGQNYTKCLRIGQGFNENNIHSRFWLGSPNSTEPVTAVDSYLSDLATFFNSTTDFSSNIIACLTTPTSPSCNWDAIFSTPLPPSLQNSSLNTGLISYSIPNAPNTNSESRIYCDTITYLSFPTYSLDTSLSSNELHLVQLDDLEEHKATQRSPLIVSPDWFLAAWSVDRNGTADGTRLITRELRRALRAFWSDQSDSNSLQLFLYHIYVLGQALSLVNYYSSPPTSSETQSPHNDHDPTHPLLTTNVQLHVWTWSLSGRTSKLGVVITILGCVIVLARLVLGVGWPRREYSPVEMMMAAMEWRENDDGESRQGFRDVEGEREAARIRWRVGDKEGGRLGFLRAE